MGNGSPNIQTTASSGIFNGLSYMLNSLNSSAGGNSIDTAALNSGLKTLDGTASGALNNQNTLNSILEEETTDLHNRIQNMNGSVDAAKRTLELNESVRKRSEDYNILLYYFITMMVIISVLSIFNRLLPILSGGVFDVFLVLIACIFLLLIINKYISIANRDLINYDEVALPKPSNVSLSNAQIVAQNNKNLKSLAGTGMIFNLPQPAPLNCPNQPAHPIATTQPPSSTQTTNINTTTTMQNGFTLMSEVEPNSFYEYSNYSSLV
jgi:hypothetical protein